MEAKSLTAAINAFATSLIILLIKLSLSFQELQLMQSTAASLLISRQESFVEVIVAAYNFLRFNSR